jgi:hypothetical protein
VSVSRPRVGSVASVAAAVAIAFFAASRFLYANAIWNPGYYGDFGLRANPRAGFAVSSVVPGSPADRAGIKVGDTIERPQSPHDRLVLTRIAPRPGERSTFVVVRGGERRVVTLEARPLPPLAGPGRFLLGLYFSWLFVFVGVSLVLAALRPSFMTWGFAFFPLNLTIIFSPSDLYFSYLPTGWFVAMRVAEDLIAPAGIIGFLIFGLRFPTIEPAGWRRALEWLAPLLFAVICVPLLYWDFVNLAIAPNAMLPYIGDVVAIAIFASGATAIAVERARASVEERARLGWVLAGLVIAVIAAIVGLWKQSVEGGPQQHWTAHATLLLGTIAVLITYAESRGLERQRLKWVVLGVVCAWIADGANHLGLSLASLYNPKWFIGLIEPLYVVLPLSVTYAVIKHRVIDVRFILSRLLTFAAIGAAVGAVAWLFSFMLPNSQLGAAMYVALALVIGFSLNTARRKIAKLIDRAFFRPWQVAQEEIDAIDDRIRRAVSRADVYETLAAGVNAAISIASTAVFERMESGGYVRVADRGWPPGSLWHILPEDPLAICAEQSRRPQSIDAVRWPESEVPSGLARPLLLTPIVAGRTVMGLLLASAHADGSGVAPDEIALTRRVCASAGVTLRLLDDARRAGDRLLGRQHALG